jgi:8-oxo-dGTP pyrophosphatase MutT (NUDIX family)
MIRSPAMVLVRSAGGVVWRDGPRGRTLAVVHRPDRDDWSLPKGKLDAGEAWHRAALREVAEETGCRARLDRFAGGKLFVDRDVPKLVLYWHMQVLREGLPDDEGEVDEVAWLPPRQALARLDHASDRRLLLRALAADPWRDRGRGAGGPPGRDALRRLLVVDGRCSDEVVAPFLRLAEGALARDRRRATAARR